MKQAKRGNALVMTIMMLAIASVWFALVLAVAANFTSVSRDEIAREQAQWLAHGAMVEAMHRVEQAAGSGELAALANPVVWREDGRTAQVGLMRADWRPKGSRELTIEAQGRTSKSKYAITGEFLLAELPSGASGSRPILWLKGETRLAEALAQTTGYDHLLQSAAGGLTLQVEEPVSGNLYCLGDGGDWTVTIKALSLSDGLLYIDGHGYLNGRLQARELVVSGDLYLAPGSTLDCPRVVVYGQLLGEAPPDAAAVDDAPPPLALTTALVVERMQQ